MGWFTSDREKYDTLATAWVLPEPKRCVQCGVCSFNCPMAIDVRRHVWLREPVVDHGSRTAISTVARSTFRIRASGSRRAERTSPSPDRPGSLLTASVMRPLARPDLSRKPSEAAGAPQSRPLKLEWLGPLVPVQCTGGLENAAAILTRSA